MNKLQPIKPLLSSIPAVHEIQKISEVQNLINIHGHSLVTQAIRTTQTEFRELLLSSGTSKNKKIKNLEFLNQLKKNLSLITNDSLQGVFNLTGTVLHTNFGRALLPKEAINSVNQIASEPSNLEYDILNNKRGDRDSHIDERLCRLIGAFTSIQCRPNRSWLQRSVILFIHYARSCLESLFWGRNLTVGPVWLSDLFVLGSWRRP